MLKDLYAAIRDDAAPVIVKIDGRDYSDKRIYPVNAPMPNVLVVSTLTGLVDYLKSGTDNLELANVFCHVVTAYCGMSIHEIVQIILYFNEINTRWIYLNPKWAACIPHFLRYNLRYLAWKPEIYGMRYRKLQRE